MTGRTLHLGGFLKPAGEYLAGWRHPEAPRAAGVDFEFIAGLVKRLEAAKFDAVFFPDLVGVPDSPDAVLERVAVVNDALEPTVLLGALAAVTNRIGLVATASTSYSEPYTTARVFAAIDHISHGRAGWNVVTSLNDAEARNYGLDSHLLHADRYRRAEEFYDVVEGLWDSVEEGGFVEDKASGIYLDTARRHRLDHRGEFFTVAGPLNIRRPVQGRPIIAQAGSSGAGQALAARIADLVFTRAQAIEPSREQYAAIKARAAGFGRNPDEILVLPELATVVGRTRAEAEDKFAAVRELLHPRVALADVEYWLRADLASLPADSPLPPLPATNASQGAQAELYAQAVQDGLTVGGLVAFVAEGDGAVIGTADDVADRIEEYFTTGAADGFNVSFPYLPGTLEDFTSLVVPELQRRGLFRTEYEGETLREHLGLAPPASRWKT
ncbi:LLM class flavin-dependent oxidoreductase [Gryllotalpicola sp.]|uniref:LLM class flavin-dependent oxidoreductase n=1 Tax=Gryllotalpicola sp. TaxID=1932787 RepID=UPI00260E4BDA|nr:LLM class flavin-dependent oxidoreductase [Gryllotalpicola sp.]